MIRFALYKDPPMLRSSSLFCNILIKGKNQIIILTFLYNVYLKATE